MLLYQLSVFVSSRLSIYIWIAFVINFIDSKELFMQVAFAGWVILFVLFATIFQEPIKENANFSNFQIEFGK